MVQGLIDYVKKMREQGYSPASIRGSLLNAGYPQTAVDSAIRNSAPKRKVGTKILLIAFFFIGFLALIALVTLKIVTPPPAVVTYDLQLFSKTLAPDGELLITTTLTNPAARKVTVLLDYTLSGPEGKIKQDTVNVQLVEQEVISKSFNIPKNALDGTYKIKVDLSYQTTQLSKSKTFKVQEQKKIEQAPIETLEPESVTKARTSQLNCPTRCDDFDFCTTNSCVEGRCVFTPQIPCCGNNNCENGETENSCGLDCAEKKPNPEDISKKASKQSTTDIPMAITICEGLVQQAYIDSCLLDVAQTSKNKQACDVVAAEAMQDACYIPFAYNQDFSVCNKINNPSTKNTCNTLQDISILTQNPLVQAELEKQKDNN